MALGERTAVLDGQKRALELAIHGAAVPEILEVLVRAIEAHDGQGMIASFQLVDGDRLRHGAAPNLPDAYNAAVDGFPIGPEQGSCGTAAFTGEPVSVSDIARDPRWAHVKDIATQHGLAACWSMPVRSPRGEIVGTFAHYYREPRDPTPRDPEAVAWIAHTAGLVIDAARETRRRQGAEAALASARDDLARQVAGLHLVHELAIGLHAPSELAPALELALDVAIRLHGAKAGLLFRYRDRQLGIVAAQGFERAPAELLARLTAHVERHDGERIVITDTETDARYAELVELSRLIGFRALHRTPIRSRAGKPLGVLVVHFEQPHSPPPVELELTDLCVRYAADAIERAISVDELQQAKESAERANRAKDEFLAILGHELRNPLAPIASALELLEVRAGDESVRSLRTVIQRQLGHLTRLVDDLLDVTRIRQGRIELHRTTVDVADVIARAVEMTAPQFAQRQQRIEVDAPAGMLVAGDAMRLAQVVSNLLVNAAKYSDAGKTTTITARRHADRIEIAIRDQGVGIAPEMLPRVFDLFAQEERSLERAQGGLGLGLAIVRKLVALHDGEVRAESAGIGHGSTFTLTLPALAATAVQATTTRHGRLRPQATRKILVVDDNVDVTEMMAELLAEMGHVVHVANDGGQALTLISEVAPDLALVDLGLPVLDGFELARAVRDQERRPYLIAVTGYGRASDLERAREAGFDAHLVKPVSMDTLLKTIDSVPA